MRERWDEGMRGSFRGRKKARRTSQHSRAEQSKTARQQDRSEQINAKRNSRADRAKRREGAPPAGSSSRMSGAVA